MTTKMAINAKVCNLFNIYVYIVYISYILIVADNIKNSKTRRNEKKKLYEIPERKKKCKYTNLEWLRETKEICLGNSTEVGNRLSSVYQSGSVCVCVCD